MERITHSPEETIEFAKSLAKNLKGGEVISLIGELGGGKTTFTKGLAEELRVEEPITSPTFVMLKVYPARLSSPEGSANGGQAKIGEKDIQLVHIDAYRVETLEDIKSVGIEDYLNRDDIVMVVEWAEKIKEILPAEIIKLNFEFIDENTRKIIYDFGN